MTDTDALPAAAELPVHLTRFVGRDRELQELARLVGTARLLTLTGAGGSGKTRLAREAALNAAASFARIAWVDVTPLADAQLLPQQVAIALHVPDRAGNPSFELLSGAVGTERVLLVLDNCEHLVGACAELAERLLRACPRLAVLATSREALGVASETAWLVPPLARDEAVELFVERARAALPPFALSAANATAVAEICRRLDGIPLAIELAAARVRVLSPEQIAQRLGDVFRLLTSGNRTALPRHRTLRATMEWSYRLLNEREQVLLCRLAVFAGGFTLDAAEAVCAGGPLEAEDILDGVAALVDKSLVTMEPGDGLARYGMLETVRQYGMERLAEAGACEACRERHARYFAAFAETVVPWIVLGGGDASLLARVGAELENLRTAATWAEADPARGVELLRFTDALFWYSHAIGAWSGTGQFGAARRALLGALARGADANPVLRARTLVAAGLSAFTQGHYADAHAWIEASLALMRTHGDAPGVALALSRLGAVHIMRGDATAAAQALDEAFAITRAAPMPVLRAYVCLWRGWAAHARGDWALAREMSEEAVALGRRLPHRATFAHASALLGRVEYGQGHYGRAFQRLTDALHADVEAGDGWGLGLDLEGLAALAAAQGRYMDAARIMGGVDALRERIGITLMISDRPARERLVSEVRRELGAGYDIAYRDGWALPMGELVRVATESAAEHTAEYPVPTVEPPVAPSVSSIASPLRATLRVLALGPLQVLTGDRLVEPSAWGSARPRELLVYLLMHPDGRTKEQVGLAFWPDASPAQLRNNFHVTLHRLRRTLGSPDWVTLTGERYQVNPELVTEFDVLEFEREVIAARRALKRQENGATMRLEQALTRFRGDFLDGEPAGDWHLEHRDRLQRIYVDALMELGTRMMADDRHAKAAEAFRRVLARDELHEEALRALMRCHAMLGERTQALRLYQRFADRLREELDTSPGAETKRLFERLQQGAGV